MKLITKEIDRQLAQDNDQAVAKFFTPDGSGTWVAFHRDPHDPDILWGMADLGMGFPEYGTFRLSELESVRGHFGLPIERDRYFGNEGKPAEWFMSNPPHTW